MKKKLIMVLCVLSIGIVSPVSASSDDDGAAMIADVVFARPLCLAATAVGSVFFVLALPFALASGKTDKAAEVLVKTPARATFTRPLGEFDSLKP